MKKILLRTGAIVFTLILVFCVTFSILRYSHPLFYLREPLVKEVSCIYGNRTFVLEEEDKETVLASLRKLNRGEKADWGDVVIPEGGDSTCFAIRLLGGKTVFFELLPSGIFAVDRDLYRLSGEDHAKNRFQSLEDISYQCYLKLIEERT